MIVTSHVVIVVACLPQLVTRGKAIYDTIQSLLGAFEMGVRTVLPMLQLLKLTVQS